MSTQRYQYNQTTITTENTQTKNSADNNKTPPIIHLTQEQSAGHGDHWGILTDNIEEDVPNWLQMSIDDAVMPSGLNANLDKQTISHLLLACNELCHINQVLAMTDGKPSSFINAYPCVNGPYGLNCQIKQIITNDSTQDAVLRLLSEDGSVIYAFDQLYTVNHALYQKDVSYFVNFSAWAYSIELSSKDEVIRVEDPEGIRYHRAYNDILANNNGEAPANLEEQIANWQPATDEPLAPVEINLGSMCAYLFGDTLGQEDEAWCQGQVLGKQTSSFYDRDISVFDVAILREPDAIPFVVRMATPTTSVTEGIFTGDYIQANIWLQAAIYLDNQKENGES